MRDFSAWWDRRPIWHRFFVSIVVVGLMFGVGPFIYKENFCPPSKEESWRIESNGSAASNQKDSRQFVASKEKKQTDKGDAYPHNPLCEEWKPTDVALVVFTLCLVITGWFTLRSADENTKRKERAYVVAVGLWGIPKDEWKGTWEMENRALASMYKGPWRMAVHNYGQTAGYSSTVEWGLCPKEIFHREYGRAKKKIGRLLDRAEFCEFRCKWLKPLVEVQDIFPPGKPVQYRHVVLCDEEKKVGDVFFGRIRYIDVFGDEHGSMFAIEIRQNHTHGINLTEET